MVTDGRAFDVIEHLWIPMPDGIRLSARLWLPIPPPVSERKQKVPVVLEYLPYRKRDSYRAIDDAWGPVLAGAGIAFARVDIRGTGDSEGVLLDEYSEQELDDGEVCIAWLAAQDWSNGRVGMRGISWGGINALMLAARQPPALKAILPMAASDNRFTDDAHYLGGLIGKPMLDWGVLFKTVLAGPPDPIVVGDRWEALWQARLEATPDVITGWLRHRTFDDYWQRAALCLDYASIRCPVYMVAGWHDAYVNFIGRLMSELKVPARALIGSWGHTYPSMAGPAAVDWPEEEVRWWHRWLTEEQMENGEGAALTLFVPEQTPRQCLPQAVPGRWIELEEWPDQDTERARYHFHEGRLESDRKAAAAPAILRTAHPAGFGKAEWLDRLPEDQSEDDAVSLCFETAPLIDDLTMLGRPGARLSLAFADEDGAVGVRLLDVDEDGRSWLVSYAVLDPAFRQGFTQRAPTPAGARMELDVSLHLAAHRFKRGHRLRLAVSGPLWPLTWPSSAETDITLFPEDCSLDLPLLPDGIDSLKAPWLTLPNTDVAVPAPLPDVEHTPAGEWRYRSVQTPFRYPVAEVGTTLAGAAEFEATLGSTGDSRWHHHVRREWQRDEWQCAVEAACTMERVAAGILVRESLRAYRGDVLVFERDHEAILPNTRHPR